MSIIDNNEKWVQLIYNIDSDNPEPTVYEISNKGRIRHSVTKHLKAIQKDHNGHCRVSLHLKNNVRAFPLVHRLVALHFIPVPSRYLEAGLSARDLVVDHIKELKDDPYTRDNNTVDNLQWLTVEENLLKEVHPDNYLILKLEPNLSGQLKGELNPATKFSDETIENVCKDLENNVLTLSEIANKNGVTKAVVQQIKYGICWH